MNLLNQIMNMGVAYGQQAAGQPKGPGMMDFLPMIAIMFLFMYLFIIRPQTKKAKQHETMLKTLKSGDEVVTTGGIIGKVKSIADGFILLELCAGTNVKVLKSNVVTMTKEPAAGAAVKKD